MSIVCFMRHGNFAAMCDLYSANIVIKNENITSRASFFIHFYKIAPPSAIFFVVLQRKKRNRETMPKYSPEQMLRKKIERRFNKAVVDYRMLDDGDRILVALSGGKDSLALLELLAARSRIFKPRISIVAAHIRLRNIEYLSDASVLEEFCSRNGVEFHLIESEFDASTDKRKSPCFLCSWNRRKALFTLAQELGCNKLALGHNMDDFLETLLMNITFQGAFSAMAPTMEMKKFPLTVIRPLCLTNEEDIETLAGLAEYPKQVKRCPYERDSNREQMRLLLKQLEALNPEARYNLWGSMSNIQPELLPPHIEKTQK